MIKIGNNRQKLVLNRPYKPSVHASPQKPQLQIINFVKLSTLQPQLSKKDKKNTRLTDSSIIQNFSRELKLNQNHNKNKLNTTHFQLKRKSFSLKEHFAKQINVNMQNVQRRVSKTLEKISAQQISLESTIHQICKDTIDRLKQKGTLTFKNNQYSIKKPNFHQAIIEIVKQSIQQSQRAKKKLQEYQRINIQQASQKKQQKCNIQRQFSIHQTIRKSRNISFQPLIINFHAEYRQESNEKQLFWKIVQNLQMQNPKQQNFIFLVNRFRYLKQQIRNKQLSSIQLNQNIEQLNEKILAQTKNSQLLQQKINQHQNYLSLIESKIKDISQFVNNQPNKILRSQAQGYKEREQQLFDQAFILQQSTPLYIDSYIGDCIMIPNQSFKLTLKSFPHQNLDQNNYYKVTQKDMNAFKSSLCKAYQSVIEKLSSIIQKKFEKITKFVGIMRRLASYTIGKREYLTEINKKMAILSTNIDKHSKKLQDFFLKLQNNNGQSMKIVVETKNLFNSLRTLYCQAQVFY